MLHHITEAFRRSHERARHRREVRALLSLEDHLLRDIGLQRDEVRSRIARLWRLSAPRRAFRPAEPPGPPRPGGSRPDPPAEGHPHGHRHPRRPRRGGRRGRPRGGARDADRRLRGRCRRPHASTPAATPTASGSPASPTPSPARAFTRGRIDRTADDLGAAVWFPPGLHPDGEAIGAYLEATIPPERLGPLAAGMEAQGRFHPEAPHWYLPWIGVRPEAQGRGIGAALLAHGLARADSDGVPAYLEATSRRNAALYRPARLRGRGRRRGPRLSRDPADVAPCPRLTAPSRTGDSTMFTPLRLTLSAGVAALALASAARAHDEAKHGAELYRPGVAHAAGTAATGEGRPPLYAGLGELRHDRGHGLARGAGLFRPGAAARSGASTTPRRVRAFRAAQRLDPACAMCFWGEAFALGPNINDADGARTAIAPARRPITRAMELALDQATPRRSAR